LSLLRSTFVTLALASCLAALSGCGGGASNQGVAGAQKTKRCASAGVHAVGSNRVSWAAIVDRPTRAYRRPGRTPFARFETVNVNGVPMVFGVLERLTAGCAARWYRVELPIKPNGATGWVRADHVTLAPVATRVLVDLSDRRVTLYRRGREVLHTTAAIGSPATPTPVGRFYVNQRLIPRDPTGPFGPGAIGISAFSEVLTGWTQGGPIAIHGTNDPSSIGRNISNGCIRVRNDVLRRLFAATLAGTPVEIRR
jgi:lipoprotein-anchoring transpeptidase ErfK/SrfK